MAGSVIFFPVLYILPFWNGGSESRPEVVLILWESTRFTRRYMRLSIFLVGMSSEDQRGILSIVSEADLWVFSTMTFFSFNLFWLS